MRPFDFTKTLALGLLAVVLGTHTAAAQCPAADAFEPNDDCASAVPIAIGTHSNLTLFGTNNGQTENLDYYSVSVPAGEILTVDCLFVDALGDMDLRLYDDLACANQVDASTSVSDNEQVSFNNTSGGAVTMILFVDPWSVDCNDYSLVVGTMADPCVSPVDDSFEPNDTCGAAVALPLGMTAGLFISDVDGDYYTVSVPAGMILTVDAAYSTAFGDVDLLIYDDPACLSLVDSDTSGGGNGQVIWANTTGAAASVVVRTAVGAGEPCNTYSLNLTTVADPCANPTDDSFEENDDCASAVALAVGAHANLYASETDGDFYSISVPAGNILTVDATYSVSAGEVEAYLYDDLSCANEVDNDTGGGGAGQVTWINRTGAMATVALETRIPAGEVCNFYILNVAVALDPCQVPSNDDLLEDNDDCASATVVAGTSYSQTALFVSVTDSDYFTFTMGDGGTATMDITFLDSNGDLDLELYDQDNVTAGTCGDDTAVLDESTSVSDDEQLIWTNSTGSSQTYYLRVLVWDGNPDSDCNTYDLNIDISGGQIATALCFGDGSAMACPCGNESVVGAGEGCNWSSGVGAILTASGSTSVAADDIAFHVSQARAGQPSMLVQGSVLIATPFKDGVLCMGNPTERVEVVFLDGSGAGSTASSIVTEGNVSPGDTRFYQQWFRDPGGVSPCGTGSNFTQGLQVTYSI